MFNLNKDKKKPYTENELIKALTEIKEKKLTIRATSIKYNIPRSTLGIR